MADERKIKTGGPLLRALERHGFERVTFFLIFICVAAFAVKFTYGPGILEPLFISGSDIRDAGEMKIGQAFHARLQAIHYVLPEIRSGQIWRLVTPIFLHKTFFQIFFYMLFLRALGSMIETHRSRLLLVILVVVLATVCNLAGYFLLGASFAGMSGVVYGLAGYIGVRGKLDPRTELSVHFTTAAMMFMWFLVCLVGLQGGNIVTLENLTGLLLGMVWAAIAHFAVFLRRRSKT